MKSSNAQLEPGDLVSLTGIFGEKNCFVCNLNKNDAYVEKGKIGMYLKHLNGATNDIWILVSGQIWLTSSDWVEKVK